MAGFLLCDLYVTRRDWKPSWTWDLVAVCGWPLVWYIGTQASHIVLPFVIVLQYLAAFRGRLCSDLFSQSIITDIGGMCYSLYLFHFLIISAVTRVSKPLHIGQDFWAYYLLQSVLVLPVVLLLCGIFFLLVERPCMDSELAPQILESMVCFAVRTSSEHDRKASLGDLPQFSFHEIPARSSSVFLPSCLCSGSI